MFVDAVVDKNIFYVRYIFFPQSRTSIVPFVYSDRDNNVENAKCSTCNTSGVFTNKFLSLHSG